MKNKLFWTSLLAFLLIACSTPETATPEAIPSTEMAAIPTSEPVPEVTPAAQDTPTDEIPEPPAAEPTAFLIESIEVTYFTPAQGEGPYYTVDKPADRDNDLTVVAGADGQPVGQVLEFSGKLYNAAGDPIEGAVIEIWQTDGNGVYLHPGDPSTGERDRNFQFYGEATTLADGSYWFRTILPGKYEPRPIHIHFKVLINGEVVLTSQFYFAADPALATDGLVAAAGGESEHLIVTLSSGLDANGNPILVGDRDIVLQID